MTVGGRDSRQIVEFGIRLAVTGKERDRRAAGFGKCAKFLNTVGPVAAAAKQAHNHKFRPGHRVGKIAVHRERVVQAEIVGNPDVQSCRLGIPCLHGRRQQADLGIGRCQDDNIAGGLAEIDGLVGIVKRPAVFDPK